ncbi:MAG: hypothetical protein Ct9H300mP29_2410 [Candidatus Neomarinimicrobiota bacterium]|nr:MAG: hypothetical protein Ct9H300mP29_2410 [Candidatus Neomarinimicrobiota bacterium]
MTQVVTTLFLLRFAVGPWCTYFASLRYLNSDGPYNENATLNGAPVGYSAPNPKPGSMTRDSLWLVLPKYCADR